MDRWSEHRDFFIAQIASWAAFVPETDAEHKDRAERIERAKHHLDRTLRCQHGRAREVWDALAEIQERYPVSEWGKRGVAELIAERNRLIGMEDDNTLN